MRHEEDEEEEGGGRKGGRKERMMIRIMTSWALGIGRRRGKTGKRRRRRRRNAARALSFRWGDLDFVPLFLNSGAQGSITSKRGVPSLQGLCRVFAGGGPCKDPAKLESWRPLRADLGRIDQKEGRR